MRDVGTRTYVHGRQNPNKLGPASPSGSAGAWGASTRPRRADGRLESALAPGPRLYSERRSASARPRVLMSAYSSSPPTATPLAILVTGTPSGLKSRAR